MLFLYQKFHSPLFPFYNAYFQSPFWERELADMRDVGWGPKTLWGALKLPYSLTHTTRGFVGELPLRDWRLAAVAGGFWLVVFTSVWRISRAKSVLAAIQQPTGYSLRAPAQVFIFFAVSYVLWLGVFGIYRYLVPLEMMTGTLLVGLLVVAVRNRMVQAAIGLPLILAILVTTRVPDWGRTPFGERFFEVQVPPIASGSLVLLLDNQPLAYLVPFFPDDARFVGPWWSGYRNYDFTNPRYHNLLQQRINAEIARHRGAIYSIELARTAKGDKNSAPGSAAATLPLYGLRHDSRGCQPIRSNVEKQAMVLCSLERGT
jgi:hypothetical protein